ncbi:Beta-glucuronidase [Penicillium ucsense]|uniref:Beta-glucuronidase n=1 Tax=Penicillium ucsense TaxID=2839758 RepID=A0A8J8VX83_9EURO|nr:Beta-glucuronidase [Penicillium ucsense]KAF7731324.1 Beta-glucuronidase [Penicillium ucsense]
MIFRHSYTCILGALFLAAVCTAEIKLYYTVPSIVPLDATPLDSTPVGVSLEFFMWPSYMTNVTPSVSCMSRISEIYGKKMPIRIGGTTQDRATYDPYFDDYVFYSVADPSDAPDTLIYGPKFWDLINEYNGETMLGFNRGDNNQTNTYLAVQEAKKRALDHLWAIELGNEPDVYIWAHKPDAVSPWNASQEGLDAANWAQGFIDVWKSPLPILTAGSYAVAYADNPEWPNTDYLIHTAYNNTVKAAVKYYSGHLYAAPPGNNTLAIEMNHARTVSDLAVLGERASTAASINSLYILGETNFHPYDVDMDATFGAAIATLDKSLRAVTLGIQRLFFHQGTINQALFNWWSEAQINAPYYGGYFAALALAGGDRIIELDSGNSSHAQYVIYSNGRPIKAILVNTDYFSGSGVRSCSKITLNGLPAGSQVRTLRMTAGSSDVTTNDSGIYPTIGGQHFSNVDCSSVGDLKYERDAVRGGQVTLTVAASEALLVYL